jgi:hypothetical protein
MAEGIQLLDLPQAAIGEIEGGNFAYMVTPDGRPFKVDISQLVAKMQSDAGCGCVQNSRVVLDAADIAALNTTPAVLTPTPSATEYIEPIAINVIYNHGGTDFTGGGALIFSIANAAGPIASLADIIEESSSKHGRAAFLSSGTDSQYVAGEPLVALTLVGPTGGDGSMIINTLYAVRSTLAVV